MTRSKNLILLVALSLVAPAAISARAANLGSDYDILNRKSIFSKDRVPAPREDRENGVSRRDRQRTQRRSYVPVLVGVMLEDDGYVAFIADPSSNDIITVRPGDALPSSAGVVKDVTLDYIETVATADKPIKRVLVGQNILGGVAEYPDANAGDGSGDAGATATSASTDNTAGDNNNGGSSASPAPSGPAPTGNSPDDIAERLRRRRLAEMGK